MGEYLRRFYREHVQAAGLVSFNVVLEESDLFIFAVRDLSAAARSSLARHRGDLEEFISRQPRFGTSFVPYTVPEASPPLVTLMAEASARVGVGPMAAVAGAIADMVGEDLASLSTEVIVENGGDIHIRSGRERRVGVFAGGSPFSGRLALRIPPTSAQGLGVCTSSATVGPSYSAGGADSALVVAESAALADAAASALGNRAKTPGYIEEAVNGVAAIEGVIGCLVVMGEDLGVRGDLQLEGV
ncbi:MAG: UPF0280 family protein [Actinobacteria bacterium]|jgi:ApbE superfamily uncharacterized protein (UPF0280 family)|nr:MAG: UPF0280 family protein [Actinomycetota bacterium]